MAAPIVPIIKKVAVAVLGDKDLRGVVLCIVGTILVFLFLPFIILYCLFLAAGETEPPPIPTTPQMYSIESGLLEACKNHGLSDGEIAEAELLAVALLQYADANDATFAEKVASCYAGTDTDEALCAKVNATFGVNLSVAQYQGLVADIRTEQKGEEP